MVIAFHFEFLWEAFHDKVFPRLRPRRCRGPSLVEPRVPGAVELV